MLSLILAVALAVPNPAPNPDKYPDASFYKTAAEGGIAEVELGNLAQRKSDTPSLKEFAALMVSDHSAENEELRAVAAAKNIKLPSKPSVSQRARKSALEALSGPAFDKSYIKHMIKDHEEDIELFSREANNGNDPDAKNYAATTLPTLKAHLQKIKMIASSSNLRPTGQPE